MAASAFISKMTTTRAGRIRIVSAEWISLESGKSTILRGGEMFQDPTLGPILLEITERPNLFDPTVTDGGLRFASTDRFGTWYVYSW